MKHFRSVAGLLEWTASHPEQLLGLLPLLGDIQGIEEIAEMFLKVGDTYNESDAKWVVKNESCSSIFSVFSHCSCHYSRKYPAEKQNLRFCGLLPTGHSILPNHLVR